MNNSTTLGIQIQLRWNQLWFLALATLLAISLGTQAQVSVLHTQLHPMNVTPKQSLQASLMNQGGVTKVQLKAVILNSDGQMVMQAMSAPVDLKTGVNQVQANQLSVMNSVYASNAAGNYSKTHSRLPTGIYIHCLTVVPLNGAEGVDEYCQDLETENEGLFQLSFPYDHGSVENRYPVFIWANSDPLNNWDQGTFFQLVLVELQKGQSAQAGLALNTPVFLKTNLTQHQVSYPMDAPRLKQRTRYAWHIQKLSQGRVVSQTDAWEFEFAPPAQQSGDNYAVLKRELDASFYEVSNDQLFFGFDEKYHKGEVICRIYNEHQKEILPQLKNTEQEDKPNVISGGYNNFQLDLSPYALKPGFYYLEVLNQKAEKFRLRFYVT